MSEGWIAIPAGQTTVNVVVNRQGFFSFLKKWEAQTIDVPAFEIAKYPVTVADYELFIQAGGYQEAKWWDGLAKRIESPESLPEFSESTHPRVNVTWFEAIAYCRWLSDKTGQRIQLPTEGQWLRAAQGTDGRTYPWGNDWEDDRCNWVREGTTPVGKFDGKGDSPYRVSDMLGNVWEWCVSEFVGGSADLAISGKRVMKGGSWNLNPELIRLTYRSGDFPSESFGDVGFRCVRVG